MDDGNDLDRLLKLLEDLTGEPAPIRPVNLTGAVLPLRGGRGLGLSQLNEILLLCGYDRVSDGFFQYLVNRSPDYQPGAELASFAELEDGIRDFRKLALLIYGNVKFAYKKLSGDPEVLREWLSSLAPVDPAVFRVRHAPVLPIREIAPIRAYLWGYLVEEQIEEQLKGDPNDKNARAKKADREQSIPEGLRNHYAYLASGHLDVYVATSMREPHEFLLVNRVAREIFAHRSIRDLRLRWFDPTQAYCPDRIDKGLAEALMLRRAKCTIYLAQESESLGKDSELASTLAQGKPVIAYVPRADDAYVDSLIADLREAYPTRPLTELLLEQLRVFSVGLAWQDPEVRGWLGDVSRVSAGTVEARLRVEMKGAYDKRAEMLKERHPLGIQVYFASGVANGVLVVRTIAECAQLIRRILTRTLEFALEDYERDGRRYTVLRERISSSIFRVVTGDTMLTNAFWNFYLVPEG